MNTALYCFMSIALLQSIVAMDIPIAIYGSYQEPFGSFVSIVLCLFVFALGQKANKKDYESLARFIIMLSGAMSYYALAEYAMGGVWGYPIYGNIANGWRCGSVFGSPVFFGSALVPMFPAVMLIRRKMTLLLGCCTFLGIVGLYLSGCRAACLGTLAGGLATYWMTSGGHRQSRQLIKAAIIIGLGLVAMISYKRIASDVGRIDIWMVGLKAFMAHPFGWGWDNFSLAYINSNPNISETLWQQAHNDILQVMVCAGIPGIVFYLWLSWEAFKHSLKSALTAGVLVGLFIHAKFNPVSLYPMVVLSFLLGSNQGRIRKVIAIPILAVILLVLCCRFVADNYYGASLAKLRQGKPYEAMVYAPEVFKWCPDEIQYRVKYAGIYTRLLQDKNIESYQDGVSSIQYIISETKKRHPHHFLVYEMQKNLDMVNQ